MQHRVIFLIAVMSAVGHVTSSCDHIALPKCECKYPMAKRYEIECQSRGLSSLPNKVNFTLENADASGNFSFNSIDSIPDYYFLYMKHYDILDFTSNRISKFDKNTLAGLESRLTTLILKQNRISSIPEGAIRNYIRLNHLDLSWNRVSSPCRIDTADVITYSLAHNGITSIADRCFVDSNQVRSLDLSQNEISSISVDAFEGMTRLETLDLGYNVLSDLKDGLSSLTRITTLRSLSLRGNSLEYLGSICHFNLKFIESIDFGFNDLVDIQKYCFASYADQMPASEISLNFEHNAITTLASSVFAGLNDRLTDLRLNGNRISDINVNTFKNLAKLAKLNLDKNSITSLEFLRNWKDNSLQELSVAHNLISELTPAVFAKMLKLTKLSLDGNRLLSIEPLAFTGMLVLDDLSLRYNLLTDLAPNAFGGLENLKKLRLSGNALVTFKNCTFANLDRLVLFHFEDNLLHCDCDLLWMLNFISKVNKQGTAGGAEPVLEDFCHYPTAVYGKYMDNEVSLRCGDELTNACFSLRVTYDEPVDEAMNVTWIWKTENPASALQSAVLSQRNVETNQLVFNELVTTQPKPVTLPTVEEDAVYKICVAIVLENNRKQTDCVIYPRMIKKPTTTMAPTTEMMTPAPQSQAGTIAAIILGILLIIIIILIVLFIVYLWKTEKYRYIVPRKYGGQHNSDHETGSADRSPSSEGKSDPLDFRGASEIDSMIGRPAYEEDDL